MEKNIEITTTNIEINKDNQYTPRLEENTEEKHCLDQGITTKDIPLNLQGLDSSDEDEKILGQLTVPEPTLQKKLSDGKYEDYKEFFQEGQNQLALKQMEMKKKRSDMMIEAMNQESDSPRISVKMSFDEK